MRGALLVLIFLSLFCAFGARADAPPLPPVIAPPASQPAVAPPSLGLGTGNNCAAKYYPALAIRLNHEGSTVVDVSIDETGKVSKAVLAASSGFTELDQAAIDCVAKEWHFTPAMQNGKPVASVKQYRIVWKLTDPQTTRPWLKSDPDNLCGPIFASAKIRWPAYRAATLQFRVSTTGLIEFPFVAIPSGDDLFDAKTIECMTKMRYVPAMLTGVTSEVSWSAAVLWSPQTGLAFADSRDMGPYCPDGDFPDSMWKDDPPNPTDISFQNNGVFGGNFAIEQQSGNPELDQAALACIKKLLLPLMPGTSAIMNYGHLVRFNWREGHAFTLYVRGN
jgi:TonB family protein